MVRSPKKSTRVLLAQRHEAILACVGECRRVAAGRHGGTAAAELQTEDVESTATPSPM